jgi:predicted PurR-regulated permease PerM
MTPADERPPNQSPNTAAEPSDKQVMRIEISLSTMLAMSSIVVAAWLAIKLFPVILVLITALVLVGTLSPAIEWLETKGVRRAIGIALVFAALFIAAVLVVTLTIPEIAEQLSSLASQAPALRTKLVTFLKGSQLTSELGNSIEHLRYDALINSSVSMAFAWSTRLLEILAYSVAAIFLALYMLIDRDRLRGGLYAMVPRAHHMRLSRIMLNLETIVGGYLRGQLITCALMGIFVFILLTACGIPNALAIAVFGGIVDVLPYVGIFLTIGPAVLAALAKGPVITITVLVLMLVYEELESRLLVPIVYGRALRLPSSVVLFSLIVGSSLLGIIGALFALPVAAALLMLIDELRIELPGTSSQGELDTVHKNDKDNEQEYERRSSGLPTDQAAAIAIEISADRKRSAGDLPDSPVPASERKSPSA